MSIRCSVSRGGWTLASSLGLLLIFRGTLDIRASRQYPSVQGALLLIWVGLFALFRGISEIVIAFEVGSRQRG